MRSKPISRSDERDEGRNATKSHSSPSTEASLDGRSPCAYRNRYHRREGRKMDAWFYGSRTISPGQYSLVQYNSVSESFYPASIVMRGRFLRYSFYLAKNSLINPASI